MNWKKAFWGVISLFLLSAFLSPNLLAGAASPQPGAHFVRLPAAASAAFNHLGLQPRADLDYGAFRWLELSDANYAALSASGLSYTPVPDGGTLSVMRYRFDPAVDGEPNLPPAMQAAGGRPGLRLVQFSGPVQDAWLSQLNAAGADVLQYYPSNTYLVWADAAQVETVAAQPFVRWTGAFHSAYKLSSTLAGRSGWIEDVAVTLYNDGHLDATLADIAGLGAVYVQHFPAQPDRRFYTAIFKADAAVLASVARLAPVWAIEYSAPRPSLDDEVGAQIIAGNYPGGTPVTGYYDWLAQKGVNGAGITWADVDTGLDSDHPDITGRAVAYVNYGSPANQDSDGHGSHTAGAIFGDPLDGLGIQDPSGFYWGLGAAPSASLVVQNGLMGSWPPSGGWQAFSRDSLINGAIGSSNSWYSAPAGSGYTVNCRTHDLMVRDGNFDTPNVAEQFIMVFSAGNAGPGPSTLTEPKEAKNLIVVGASMNYPRSGANINGMASYSSRGPAIDGRILPNVTAPGDNTTSFRSDQGGGSCTTPVSGAGAPYYSYCSGTSMAAPFVSGSSALIADWWNQENGVDPSPAMVKALLINGAADMVGGSGVGGNIPNNNQGWGRTHLDDVIRNGAENIYSDQVQVFHATGESWSINFGVPDPTKPMKVTLVWADAAGAAGANPALVNNLDLTVVNGGNTYLGNHFTNGWSTPGGSADALNNIESVYIQNPAGSAAITVQATGINGDGVPYNGDTTDQDFAIVCYNCVLKADFTLAAAPSAQSVCAPDEAVYSVELGQIWNFSQPVALSTVDLPAGLSAVFTPNPATPPATVELRLGDTLSATAGTYQIGITGAAITQTHSVTVGLELFSGLPSVPALLTPPAEERNVIYRPTFTWQAEQGKLYDIEIATDAGFTNVIASASGLETASYTPDADLPANTVLYWHVRANNTCGATAWSAPFRFLTEAGIGQCALGTAPVLALSEGFENLSLPAGWTTGGTGSTWDVSLTRKHSGLRSVKGTDVDTVSDQWLISPAMVLPSSQSPLTLSFWGYRKFQPGGCLDGGLAEISTDGGTTWTQLDAQIRLGAYDAAINSASNPLYGKDAWCLSQSTWINTVAALDEFAGQTVQLRFRLGTDNSIGYEGWYVDDVSVQSCVASTTLGPASSLPVLPGESVVHSFTLANLSSAADSFSLSVSGNAWPAAVVSADPITLTAGATATVSVKVDAPLDFTALSDSFTLAAASLGIPGITVQATGETHLNFQAAVLLGSDQIGIGQPGQLVEYEFSLTNLGTYTDTFTLSVSGVWTTTLPEGASTGPLPAGQTIYVSLWVMVPAGATGGASDVATLTATSSLNGSVTATAHATTVVYFRSYLPIMKK